MALVAFSCAEEIETPIENTDDQTTGETIEPTIEMIPAEEVGMDTICTVRHILVGAGQSFANRSTESAEKRADSILDRLNAGEDWNSLLSLSDDVGSIPQDGVYKGFARGQMVPPFENYAFSAPLNQFATIETRYGFHVMEVLNREVKMAYMINGSKHFEGDTLATVRHILIGLNNGTRSRDEALAKADSIAKGLKEGEAWDDYMVLSEDPGSLNNGGRYDDFPKNVMVKPFEAYAFGAPLNETGIVETDYGFHVVQVLNRRVVGQE